MKFYWLKQYFNPNRITTTESLLTGGSFRNLISSKPIRTIISLFFIILTILVISSTLIYSGSSDLRSITLINRQIPQSSSSISLPRWAWSYPNGRSDVELGVDVSRGLEPNYTFDKSSNLYYPPDINPMSLNGYRRANATFVSLVRNEEALTIMSSMRAVEDRVNRKLGYPWVFLNNQPFTSDFKRKVSSMTRSKVYFGLIPNEHWSYPHHINQTRAAESRKKMEENDVIYGGSESYRHMCRYNSGFFFRHPILLNFDYYWRVEPGVEYYCDMDYDPFLFMEKNKKVYGFTISLYEYRSTIETLWQSTIDFLRQNPDLISDRNSINFLVNDRSDRYFRGSDKLKVLDSDYNLCHFWSNFEVGDLRFWRSEAYLKYFEYLDSRGGFFYERWGDAPVHSIALSVLLDPSAIHWFEDIGYRHPPFSHCPKDLKKFHHTGKCFCEVSESFDSDGYSCMSRWWKVPK
ncbi:putative KRE2-alpha-1,2-mannosyltransferase [Phakopsora pachyrhizi]|uniref:KRE2-alpha-1,2-mannosyltransferase n=1 Tax=Phakopsora pachyrhizi TaxID=170000 RepID=A0AAV0BS40_PHAPC|nr:putative KRE2-alpha-1,2-mannosyltransferase [Phakopsora pachyrhizi]CAH7689480.1 putative KRE2-alpha-1,2-mannosyltransferase [Phakopsora pachyrhizi]